MPDLLFQNISSVQSDKNATPPTIASAATIAPTHFLNFVTGTTNIATITPPVTGAHMLWLVFTNAAPPDLLTTGNIVVATTVATTNRPVLLLYDPTQAKYYSAAFLAGAV